MFFLSFSHISPFVSQLMPKNVRAIASIQKVLWAKCTGMTINISESSIPTPQMRYIKLRFFFSAVGVSLPKVNRKKELKANDRKKIMAAMV